MLIVRFFIVTADNKRYRPVSFTTWALGLRCLKQHSLER